LCCCAISTTSGPRNWIAIGAYAFNGMLWSSPSWAVARVVATHSPRLNDDCDCLSQHAVTEAAHGHRRRSHVRALRRWRGRY
jgi:hypothetical protein